MFPGNLLGLAVCLFVLVLLLLRWDRVMRHVVFSVSLYEAGAAAADLEEGKNVPERVLKETFWLTSILCQLQIRFLHWLCGWIVLK